jgi:hypothetical protein
LNTVIPGAVRSAGDKALVTWMDENEDVVNSLVQQLKAEYTAKEAAALFKASNLCTSHGSSNST